MPPPRTTFRFFGPVFFLDSSDGSPDEEDAGVSAAASAAGASVAGSSAAGRLGPVPPGADSFGKTLGGEGSGEPPNTESPSDSFGCLVGRE
jgi:hypothetical protein